MDVTLSELLASFMESPLVLWVRTLGPLGSDQDLGSEERLSMFMELVDGVFLHKIMSHIDPSSTNQRLNKNVSNDVSLRLHNLTVLSAHIRTYYQEILQQLVVMPLPNILCIAKDPLSARSMEELKRLLLLILGCAVQSERKEEMIEKIKLLDIETQAAIVSHIQEVTHNQLNVLDLSWLEDGAELTPDELEPLSRSMAASLRQLIQERDKASEVILDLTQERDYLSGQQPQDGCRSLGLSGAGVGQRNGGLSQEEKQHLSVELAEAKARARHHRQELEEKTEQLMDSKHEVERLDQELQRLKQENQSLSCEARSVRAYRDEVDSLRERAARVDRLETELSRCKEKLNDVHFYKSRVEELREDNMTLLETKVLLEEQLSASRGRCEKLHGLEKDNLLLRAKIHDLEMERDGERRRLEELVEENMLLEIGQKQSMNESAHLGWELEQLAKNHDSSGTEARKSLVQELNECVSSRALKLEKENRELQASIDRLKEENHLLQEQQLHSQELDRENQGLGSKLERLQGLLDQERLTNQDMEALGEELLREKQGLEQELRALRADKDRQISELQSDRQHLAEAVASLQQRAQSDSEARVREVEAQNRLLQQSSADAASRLASLETQLRVVGEEAERLRALDGRRQEAEREAARLERSRDALSREVGALRACGERAEALDRQVTSLEQEVLRLRREAEEARREASRQEADGARLAKENLDLRCSLEGLRSSSARLGPLQEELKEAQREAQEARARLERVEEEVRAEGKRAERLEANMAALSQEKHRLEEQLERSREERQELEAGLTEAQTREEELRREAEELREERRRREDGEEERRRLQLDLEQAERSRKLLEKEGLRVRTLLDAKEAELVERGGRLEEAGKEAQAARKEAQRLKEAAARARELERENKELQKQATIDKRTLATLREELVSEKLTVQQQSVELERLGEELEQVGLSREKLLQQESSMEDSRYRLLESRLEETVQQTMRLKEEKISSLEAKLEQSSSLNASLRNQLSSAQQDGEPGGEREATAELLRLKDHLIHLEKSNSSLQTESSLLKEQLRQLENQNGSLNAQMAALQRHASTLQEQNSALHTATAQLQVENSTVSSQSASLMAQNAVLQGQVGALEAEAESWQRQREEAWRAREGVLSDHERLLGVHERQAQEYEQLISQHAGLKAKQRALEGEHRALHGKYCALLQLKEKWEEQEGRGLKEREELHQETEKNRLLQQENLQLKTEVDRLTEVQSHQQEQSRGLQQRLSELKASLGSAQLEAGQWMSRYDQLMEQHQGLDLTMTKLDNHCELLSRLKGNLEEENHHLLSQISLLSQQNHALLERSMESKELFHQEQKLYIDKLNALRRHKEKLEEKIMDQYKFYDPTPKKRSQWAGAKALAKLIKPRKEGERGRGERGGEGERGRGAPDMPLPPTPPLLPPETPPPVPKRGASDPQDAHSNHSPSLGPQSPALTPISRGSRAAYRSGGSSESVNGEEGTGLRLRLSSTPTLQSSLVLPSRPGAARRPRGVFDDQAAPDSVFSSADFSHNTSRSDSPRDPSDQLRSASLSSDDITGLGQSQPSLSRSSTLPYEQPAPRRGGGARARTRPSSPGSEMVTLEQFLQESNQQSPPVVSSGSREDLLSDYFSRSPAPSRDQATPTSYVSPTPQRQSVKPSPRQPGGQVPVAAAPVAMATASSSSPGAVAPRGSGQSLSRAFSLASADLLRSAGPDGCRGNDGAPEVVRRPDGCRGNGVRERPLSARLPDGVPLSPPLHHSPSLNLQPARAGGGHARGEVAMVTPVRAAPADGAPAKDGGAPAERPKSTPASPDPDSDPQTVWYEYGCV